MEEWRKRVFYQKQKKKKENNLEIPNEPNWVGPLNSNFNILGKNFASVDCGAKVISANKEAESINSVLTLSKDHYILNKCNVERWIIIELFEEISLDFIKICKFWTFFFKFKRFSSFRFSFPSRKKMTINWKFYLWK